MTLTADVAIGRESAGNGVQPALPVSNVVAALQGAVATAGAAKDEEVQGSDAEEAWLPQWEHAGGTQLVLMATRHVQQPLQAWGCARPCRIM